MGFISGGGSSSTSSTPSTSGGRLTLTSGTPVTTSDVVAATTIYFTPYTSDRISLYDGSNWSDISFSEISTSLSGLAANTNYDIFCYSNSGAATLEILAWTNSTTRATTLTRQNGVLVKSGVATRKYVGTFRTTDTIGQTEDSVAKRFLWNYYNQEEKAVYYAATGTTWTYATNTYRQANNDVNFEIFLLTGQSQIINATYSCGFDCPSGAYADIGWGVDSITTPIQVFGSGANPGASSTSRAFISLPLNYLLSEGFHYIAPLEKAAAGTLSFYSAQSGIKGIWKC